MSTAIETEQLKKELEAVRNVADPLKRNLLVLGVITKGLRKYRLRPILVGGRAVEFYTLGEYRTFDSDVVCAGTDELANLLTALGFKRIARHWYFEPTDTAIEIPASYISGDIKRVKRIKIGKYVVFIVGIEDLIIDRLNACVHWRSELDCDQAMTLIATHFNEIDWGYTRTRAKKAEVGEKLEELIKKIRKSA